MIKRNRDHWYYVQGIRYCSRCRTRRCNRELSGSIPCVPPSEQVKNGISIYINYAEKDSRWVRFVSNEP
jgi:hypothetical protein